MQIKIVTWNINRAAYTRKNLWKYFNQLDFDVGLFQEVYVIPYESRKNYHIVRGEMNAILIKKTRFPKIEAENVTTNFIKNGLLMDFVVSAKIKLPKRDFVFVSIYNFMGPGEDEFSDFLDAIFNYIKKHRDKTVIIGGDFNMDERFKNYLTEWGLLAKKMKQNLYQLGYTEVLSSKFGASAFTFVTSKDGKQYQLDYLFVPQNLRISKIETIDEGEFLHKKPRISDHLPIIATIEI